MPTLPIGKMTTTQWLTVSSFIKTTLKFYHLFYFDFILNYSLLIYFLPFSSTHTFFVFLLTSFCWPIFIYTLIINSKRYTHCMNVLLSRSHSYFFVLKTTIIRTTQTTSDVFFFLVFFSLMLGAVELVGWLVRLVCE